MRRPFLTTPHDSRFAVYLIPPYRVARDIAEIHYMLRKQFGFAAADRLQVHATMKGFFKKNDLPISQLIAGLDSVFEAQNPFWVEISPKFRSDQIGMGLDISNSGTALNPKLMDLRERIVGVVQPFIAEDCDFVKEDLGKPFRGHVTLAFRDIPPEMYDDVLFHEVADVAAQVHIGRGAALHEGLLIRVVVRPAAGVGVGQSYLTFDGWNEMLVHHR